LGNPIFLNNYNYSKYLQQVKTKAKENIDVNLKFQDFFASKTGSNLQKLLEYLRLAKIPVNYFSITAR